MPPVHEIKCEKTGQVIEMKRRRGKAECGWEAYQDQTYAKIESLKEELIESHSKSDSKAVQRIKNMISAYESRLNKRAKYESLQATIRNREWQL